MIEQYGKFRLIYSDIFRPSSCLTLENLNAYLNDELSDKNKHDVEKHLLDCELCTEAVEGIGFKQTENLKRTVEHLNSEIHRTIRSTQNRKKNWKPYFLIAAVLFIAIFSALYFYTKKPVNEQIYAEYFKPYPNMIPIVRGPADSNTELQQAMIKYEAEYFQDALMSLLLLLETEPENMTAHFYAGISNLALEKTDEAITHFQKVIRNRDDHLVVHATWYLGLTYLLKNNPKSAKIVFELIPNNGIYKNQVIEILKKLN